MSPLRTIEDPHAGQQVLAAGAPLSSAHAAMIMVHGRGASAEDIISLSEEFPADTVAFLAPQAAGHVWYPFTFLSPLENNEPGLSSGLAVVKGLVDQATQAGIPSDRVILLGFSQGACLVLEFAARHAQRFGGVVGLSGGLIGPDGTPRNYPGAMEGTPVFLGCSVKDPHIPEPRVRLTEEVFRGLGAKVTMRLYPEPGHSVNEDEVEFVRAIVTALAG
jgi:phospholipase/carboxylesterase